MLLAAIASDAKRWAEDGISEPDLVIISGDMIQGVSGDVSDPDSEIEAQYAEAREFITALTDEVVGSDCSRVVIVPGNHDVHWGRAESAMIRLDECPSEIERLCLEPDSAFRWDWHAQQAYEIVDPELYESRYEHFRSFRAAFYGDSESALSALHANDLIFAEYPELELAVTGFASWYGNDCFCSVGEIDPAALLLSHQLLAASYMPLSLAVWHHGVKGGPRARDYMDERTVHRLIDFGYSVGLHGHQHHAGAAPYELRLPNLTSMAVVGAGSLAVGDDQLPAGEKRQFNIVTIDPHDESLTVHVRAMSTAGVFSGSHCDDFGGHTSITLSLDSSTRRKSRVTSTRILDAAMSDLARGEFEAALARLPRLTAAADT